MSCVFNDLEVLMQRSPVKVVDVVAMPGPANDIPGQPGATNTPWPRPWDDVMAMALPWVIVAVYSAMLMFCLKYQAKDIAMVQMDVEAFREDLQVLTAAWDSSSKFHKALLYFSYCRHIGSNIYGLTLALLALLANVGFALLYLEPWGRPLWEESVHLALGAFALVVAIMVEKTMRSRYAFEANKAANVVLGLVCAKSRRCQECSMSAEELVQCKEDLQEVLFGLFQLAVVPLQVAPVFLWLWMKLGSLTFLLLSAALPLALAHGRSATVPAFLAYETASRQRWDLLAQKSSDFSHDGEAQKSSDFSHDGEEVDVEFRAQQLRRQALDALQVIHHESQSLALCLSRWPQLVVLTLLLCGARWWHLSPEVLLVGFLQCHYVLRQLSLLTVLTSSKWRSCQKIEAVLQQEEVVAKVHSDSVNSHDDRPLLEMKGCFSWTVDDSPLPSLANVDLKVHHGEVVAILGTAGAGKTSFLRAACGSLTLLEGAELRRSSSCIFLPAEPWIFEGTLQQNILCGRAVDLSRYHQVLKACGLDSDLKDLPTLPRLWHQRIALARAFYGSEALLLMDDPFAGLSHEEVEELSRIFHSDLFAERSCVMSFGNSASQQTLRHRALPGLRLILLEAGTMQVVPEVPEFLNNEAFCCERSQTPFVPATAKGSPATAGSGDGSSGARSGTLHGLVSHIAKCSSFTWLSILFLDQFFQIALDWWILSTVLDPTVSTSPRWMSTLMLLGVAHLSSKLLLARFTFWRTDVITADGRSKEREMDLFLPGQIWGLVAGLCSVFAWLALSYLQLTAQLGWSLSTLSLVIVYVFTIKAALPSMPTSTKSTKSSPLHAPLQRTLELGMATTLLTGEERYFETREEEMLALFPQHDQRSFLLPLGLCLSAAYTITALLLSVNAIPSKEAILTLAPFGVLLQFLIPWTESLKDSQIWGLRWAS